MIDVLSGYFELFLISVAFAIAWSSSRRWSKPLVPARRPRGTEVVAAFLLIILSEMIFWFYDRAQWFTYFLPRSNLTVIFLNAAGVVLPTFIVLLKFGGGLDSVRLTSGDLRLSLGLGLATGTLFMIPTIFFPVAVRDTLNRMDGIAGFAILFRSFAEELQFRGFLQTRLEGLLGLTKANLLSSLIFGLWHIPSFDFSNSAILVLPNVILIFLGSLLLGYLAQKSNNLLGSTLCHIAHDLPLLLITGSG